MVFEKDFIALDNKLNGLVLKKNFKKTAAFLTKSLPCGIIEIHITPYL